MPLPPGYVMGPDGNPVHFITGNTEPPAGWTGRGAEMRPWINPPNQQATVTPQVSETYDPVMNHQTATEATPPRSGNVGFRPYERQPQYGSANMNSAPLPQRPMSKMDQSLAKNMAMFGQFGGHQGWNDAGRPDLMQYVPQGMNNMSGMYQTFMDQLGQGYDRGQGVQPAQQWLSQHGWGQPAQLPSPQQPPATQPPPMPPQQMPPQGNLGTVAPTGMIPQMQTPYQLPQPPAADNMGAPPNAYPQVMNQPGQYGQQQSAYTTGPPQIRPQTTYGI